MKKKWQIFKYICLCLYFSGSSEITAFIFILKSCLHKTLVLTTKLSEPTRSVEYTQASTDPDLCDRIISQRGELNPATFYWSACTKPGNERGCSCVLWESICLCFYDLSIRLFQQWGIFFILLHNKHMVCIYIIMLC